jgi:hypothetical protein
MVLTARDLKILAAIEQHRFLSSRHVAALIPGSPERLVRRLALLRRHGYIERYFSRRHTESRGGSAPFVYGLAASGGNILREEGLRREGRSRWLSESRLMRGESIAHAVMISDVLVALKGACRSKGVKFISPRDIQLEAFGHESRRFSWRVSTEHDHAPVHLTMVPDEIFALEEDTGSPAPSRTYYLLEADRGTMPVVRRNFSQTSIFRKLIGYYATWRQGLHRTKFGFSRIRVLTVTASRERLDHIVEVSQSLNQGKGSGLFVFADIATLRGHEILSAAMASGRVGEKTSLASNQPFQADALEQVHLF